MKSSFDSVDLLLLRVLVGAAPRCTSADLRAITARAEHSFVQGALLTSLERGACFDRGAAPLEVVRGELELSRFANVARNAWLAHASSRVSRSLGAAGIPHRIVKGGALLRYLPHPGDRWLDDVDLLFRASDRARVAAFMRSHGLAHRPHVRHDGLPSMIERDGTSADVEGPEGIPLDLHFTRGPLPASALDDETHPSRGSLASGLAHHVLVHHAGERRLLIRLAADLRALCDGGVEEVLREASRSPALAEALQWLAWLGTPELVGRLEARPLEDVSWRAGARQLAARAIVLARGGQFARALWPARAYLDAQDVQGPDRSTSSPRRRRLERIASGLRP